MKYKYKVKNFYTINNRDWKVFGQLYIPEGKSSCPLVIIAHELCATHRTEIPYATSFAEKGIACCIFDFNGGSRHSQVEISTEEMSVMSEVDDLESILEYCKNKPYVNKDKIVLFGASQGGYVSILMKNHHPEIPALILCYPALLLGDDFRKHYRVYGKAPDTFNYRDWIILGSNYMEGIWHVNIYDEIKKLNCKTLLLHGTNDELVNHSYSLKAQKVSDQIELHLIENCGHSFLNEHFPEAYHYIMKYLEEMNILED